MQTPSELFEQAQVRSAVYAAFALAFGPPGIEVKKRLATPQGLQALREVCALGGDAEMTAPTPSAAPGRHDGLEQYDRLFGHTTRGQVSAYETEYGPDTLFRQPTELGDLGGFFAAFGLVIEPAVRERVDHIRCECEFMALLAGKECFALQNGDDEMLAQTHKAQRLFLRDHLGRFAPAFGAHLERADPEGFYGAAGNLVRLFVERECERLGVQAGPATMPLRAPAPEDAAPMACGAAATCGESGCL